MPAQERNPLAEWKSIVGLVHELVDGVSDEALDHRPGGGSAMSLREAVHHIVEANVVASSIVIAALGSPGCVYDWSWMMPFDEWVERLEYDHKPVAPTLKLLEALNEYVAAQVEPLTDGLERTIQLRDAPDTELRTVTVADVLIQEVDHAREHFDDVKGR